MTISEYDGPTAWADMTAVEKMEAWLRGDVAECDEREVFKQAIREAADERAYRTGLVRENAGLQVKLAESQAEVARLRAALEQIAGYRLEQFAGPNHMALVCVSDARDAVAALEPTR